MQTAYVRLLLGVSLLGGCREERCESDSDCSLEGSRCDVARNRCVCATEAACAEDEFCNSAGICQKSSACRSNDDCSAAGTFCESGSGRCLAGPGLELGSPCSSAGQCPYGSICVDLRCAPGCYDHGDCPLGQQCIGGGCSGENGSCASTDFCSFGELCLEGTCRRDDRGAFCEPCREPTVEDRAPCGPPGSLCIVNSYGPGPDMFCGVDCSRGQTCPNGYVCSGIATLTDHECTSDAECNDERSCLIGEGRTSGFCSCGRDSDCPLDRCDPELQICSWSGADCGTDRPCPAIACEAGACIVGRNCVPVEGLYCELLSMEAERG